MNEGEKEREEKSRESDHLDRKDRISETLKDTLEGVKDDLLQLIVSVKQEPQGRKVKEEGRGIELTL